MCYTVNMFNWLSRLGSGRVSPQDMSTLQKAVEELYGAVGTLQTNVARIERKVYRDLSKDNGNDAEAAKAAFIANQEKVPAPVELGPGDQVPPGVEF